MMALRALRSGDLARRLSPSSGGSHQCQHEPPPKGKRRLVSLKQGLVLSRPIIRFCARRVCPAGLLWKPSLYDSYACKPLRPRLPADSAQCMLIRREAVAPTSEIFGRDGTQPKLDESDKPYSILWPSVGSFRNCDDAGRDLLILR